MDIIADGLWGTKTALCFTIFIASVGMISIILLFVRSDKSLFVVENAPALLTTLGILGTFFGVAQGLGSFDVHHIDQSVPILLDGMKLAFWTSILGMTFALVLKFTQFITGFFRREKNAEEISGIDIYQIMQEQNKNINDLKTAIGGDGDYSLVTQIRLMRSEASEDNKNLIKEFNDFTSRMADNNSKALIDALQEVLRDFNTKINEQFGENFKELNHAVGSLLKWQENYKTQIEAIVTHFQLAAEGIEKVHLAIENIRRNAEFIPSTMENLRALLDKLDQEIEKASELLEGFASLRNQADQVFPIVKQSLESFTRDLTESVGRSTQAVEESVLTQSRAMNEVAEKVTKMVLDSDTLMRSGVQSIQGLFKKTLEDVENSTKKQFEQLDKQLEESLQAAMVKLGSKMASVAQKLVEDCNLLTRAIGTMVARAGISERTKKS